MTEPFPGSEAKAKWKGLRDSFRRELKKMPSKSTNKNWRSKWVYFDSMIFLKDVMKFKDKESFQRSSESLDSDDESKKQNGSQTTCGRLSEADEKKDSSTRTTRSKSKTIPRKKKRDIDSDYALMDAKKKKKRIKGENVEVKDNLEEDLEEEDEDDDDDDDLSFFKSLLPYIRRLPPLRKLQVRSQYQSILIDEMHKVESMIKPLPGAFSNFTYPSSPSLSSTTTSSGSSSSSESESLSLQKRLEEVNQVDETTVWVKEEPAT